MESFDVSRYLGKWHEIAKYPFPFEKDCSFSEAEYRWDGKRNVMLIKNTCLDGNRKVKRESSGEARIPDPREKSKLKVKFFGPDAWPGEGDYIVEWTDYENYSIVGGGPFLWILARKKQVSMGDIPMFFSKIKSLGYDTGRLITNPKNFY